MDTHLSTVFEFVAFFGDKNQDFRQDEMNNRDHCHSKYRPSIRQKLSRIYTKQRKIFIKLLIPGLEFKFGDYRA